jgi:hypothetical protein
MQAGFDVSREEWAREGRRHQERTAELEAAAGISWGQPDYFEKFETIRAQARRELQREKWAREGGPQSYQHRAVFILAQSFVTTLAQLQRSLIALSNYDFPPDVKKGLQSACDEFAIALPGLKGVRDSVAHAEDRVRGEAFGKKIATQPVINSIVHAPNGGPVVVSALNNQRYGGTIADGTYAEVEIADATTEVARIAVQAVFDALPWLPGPRELEPRS